MTRHLIWVGALLALLVPTAGTAQSQTAPANAGEPRVTGRTIQGQTLTTTNGTWTGSTPMSFQYRWLRCDASGGGINGVNCATIPGETRKTLVLTRADVGHRIRSRVIASNADGTASANSNATPGVVQPSSTAGRPVLASRPAISGTPQEGQTLTVSRGSWTGGQPQTYTYQWRRCDGNGGNCSDISGATANTYRVQNADVGHTLRAQVTARNSIGARTATTTPTAVVSKAGVPAGNAISINDVALPNRLIIDRVRFSPVILRSRSPFTARFRVVDTQGHPVQGALVFVVGIPFGNTTTPRELTTGPDGFVTFVIKPTVRLKMSRGSQPFFVRARKAGDRLIGGVSTRRLVNLSVR